MKDNLNIEKLFKEKFENFEGNVNPDIWANISSGISSSAATSTGIGLGVKALIVSASVAAIGVTTYFVGGFNINESSKNEIINNPIVNVEDVNIVESNTTHETVIIAQDNDPVIIENKAEIVEELNQNTVVYNTETNQTEVVSITTTSNETHINNSNTSNTSESENTSTESSATEKNTASTTTTTVTDENTSEIEQNSELIYPTGNLEYSATSNIFQYSFTANAFDSESIRWDFGDGNFSSKENPMHTYNSAGEYKVSLMLISEDNEVYQEIKIIEIKTNSSIDNIPNVITPNGDRINDEFVIKTTKIDEFTIVITDQFGNKVFESNDKNFTWDGTDMKGDAVKKAVYTYYIFAIGEDGSILKIPGQLYVR